MPELIANRYEVIRPLGEGGLSQVVLVRDTESGVDLESLIGEFIHGNVK